MIRILLTGGAFDKEYNERSGRLSFQDTHVAECCDSAAVVSR
jgi:hypothetical protein